MRPAACASGPDKLRPAAAPPPRGRALARRAMEAARRWLRAGGGARARHSAPLLLLVVLALGGEAAAEEPRPGRQRGDEQCHYYAGGEVYPGEAARVPVSDHSLHLSQAKSRCRAGLGLPRQRGEERRGPRGGRGIPGGRPAFALPPWERWRGDRNAPPLAPR